MKHNRFLLIVAILCAWTQHAWAQSWTEVGNESSLTSAIADGAFIRLTGDISLTAYLKVGQNGTQTVTIDLNGHTLQRSGLTSAGTNGHVVEVFEKGTLTLKNGTLSGGWAENGGGICNFGSLTLTDVAVTDCKGVNGGGIHNKAGATLTISGGSITHCSSTAGGAAIVNHGTANISGCELTDNEATTRGGAIWNDGTFTATGCDISGNVATLNDGGAVHVESGQCTLNDARMVANRSTDAGAIYVASGATLSLGGNSTLKRNTSSEHGGGGIVNQGTTTLSGNVTITENTCATHGSGLWNNGTLRMEGNIQIKDNLHENEKPYTDLFLKKGKVIEVTGPLTGGAGSIHLQMEDIRGLLTSGYSASGTSAIPFSVDSETNKVAVVNGECYLLLGYYDCTWNKTKKEVVRTVKWLANDAAIDNLCTAKYASGGGLAGKDYACFVVYGNGSTTHGLQCSPGSNKLIDIILCDNSQLTITGGLHIAKGGVVRIFCQSYGEKMGKLTIEPLNDSDAGIGGTGSAQPGTIEIDGGYIKATGGALSAGIGGGAGGTGLHGSNSSIYTNINIFGGKIWAYGGARSGAGIGSGGYETDLKTGGKITIYGGEIYAEGGVGIGDYNVGTPGTITIHGGRVEAHGSGSSAGIGGGTQTDGANVTINGGQVYAYGGKWASGIGSGRNGGPNGNGGKVTINGGYVYAKGGPYGAGVGGGQITSGGEVTVNGGELWAYGGVDAAGIGTGEGPNFTTLKGGKVTITGGFVFADGTGWGAGIGGGEDVDGAEVRITGGTVIAFAGADAGEKNGCAIGSENGDGHRGSLYIGDYMMVHAGQDESDVKSHLFPYDTRVPACYFRPYARIEPCNHQDATYTIDGTTTEGTHTLQCRHCLVRTTEKHTFDDTMTCTVCHVSGAVGAVNVYLPEAVDGKYTDGHYADQPHTRHVVSGTTITLPTPPVSYLPNGVQFAGWAVGTPSTLGITSYWKGDGEQVLAPGAKYTVSADVNLTARYAGIHVTLSDAADNGETLFANSGKKAQTVTLGGRTFAKDGSWSTLCLPFNMSAEQLAANADFADAELMTLGESNFNAASGMLVLNFVEATSIEAGKPYVVRWNGGTDIQSPVFNSVTVSNSTDTTSTAYVDFVGVYSPENIYKENEWDGLYLDSGNTLRHPTSEASKLNAFRAYFVLKNVGMAGDVNGDGQLSIADVTALVNVVLGRDNGASVAQDAQTDVNGDGEVTISDVTELVGIILYKSPTSALRRVVTNIGIGFAQ